jgi:hypothetical protein
MGARIEGMDARIEGMGARIEGMDARIEGMGARIEGMGARVSASERTLREEIVAGDERILAQARLLHEDVISRLALIQEGQPRRRKRRS